MEIIEERLEEVWRTGKELGLPDSDIEEVFRAVLEEAKEKQNIKFIDEQVDGRGEETKRNIIENWKPLRTLGKSLLILFVFLFVAYVVITVHNPTRKFVTRNIQDAIYPFMTTLRILSLPVLSLFPQMSQWYSEECIIRNPLYDQPDVDCTPCAANVEPTRVADLENFTDSYYNNGKVVVVLDAFHSEQDVSWIHIVKQFDICKEEETGALKFSPMSKNQCNILAWGSLPTSGTHIEWKIDKLEILHVLRELFPRTYFVPQDTEVALHRHVFIDGAESEPYHLPLTEFANVVLVQGEGRSVFNLEPSPHCTKACKPISVKLETKEVLFFNWIFWRAIRISGSSVSTVFMSSFY